MLSDTAVFFARLRPLRDILCGDEHNRLARIDYDDDEQLASQQIDLLTFWRSNQHHWARFHKCESNGHIYAVDSESDAVVVVSPEWLIDPVFAGMPLPERSPHDAK